MKKIQQNLIKMSNNFLSNYTEFMSKLNLCKSYYLETGEENIQI